jgi:hypothetical protein
MNLFRLAATAAALVFGLTGLQSCLSPPDYPDTPEISFQSIRKLHVPGANGTGSIDTLYFTIGYRDGDGDLGLLPADLLEKPFYQDPTPGAARNRNSFNYFIQPYLKNAASDTYEPFPGVSEGAYDGQFNFLPLEDNRDKSTPIKGDLTYKLPVSLGIGFRAGQEVRFTISIQDRALHESNQVTTSSIVLGP